MGRSNRFTPTSEELDFADYATDVIEKNSVDGVPWYQSWPSALGKGFVEGVIGIGQMMNPTEDALGRFKAQQQREEFYDENIPTESGEVENYLERAGKILPGVAGAGLQALPRAAIGAGAGYLGEKFGFSPETQAILELLGSNAPDISKIIPKKLPYSEAARKENELMAQARERFNLDPEAIGHTRGSQSSLRDFGENLAAKGRKTAESIDRTRKQLGSVWDGLRGSESAQKSLSGVDASKFAQEFDKKLKKIPSVAREKVLQDYKEFIGSNQTGEDLIDLYQKINYNINKGEKGLKILKDPIKNAVMQIDEQLGKDFELVNKLYGNFSDTVSRLKPDMLEKFISKGEAGFVVSAITRGDLGMLEKVAGPLAARQFARVMVTNPRFQNLGSRFVSAMNQNKPKAAQTIFDQLIREVNKYSPEYANMMTGFDVQEVLDEVNKDRYGDFDIDQLILSLPE